MSRLGDFFLKAKTRIGQGLESESAKWRRSATLLRGIPKTAKNNPANAATIEALFGMGGVIPGVGDAVSAAEAKYRYDQGDMLGAGLAGLGALPLVPSLGGIIKNQRLHDDAIKYFGKTYSPDETGYVMDAGHRLDLSGRHYATGYQRTAPDTFKPATGQPDYLRGSRKVDHRELGELTGQGGTDGMLSFMDETGAVRYMPNTGITALDSNMPSDAQLERIVADFRRSREPLLIDITNLRGNNVASEEFDRPTVEAVRRFIQQHQKTQP